MRRARRNGATGINNSSGCFQMGMMNRISEIKFAVAELDTRAAEPAETPAPLSGMRTYRRVSDFHWRTERLELTHAVECDPILGGHSVRSPEDATESDRASLAPPLPVQDRRTLPIIFHSTTTWFPNQQ